MLINLVIKDFMLIKKYCFVLFVFTAIAPIYISSQIGDGGLVSFLLTTILVEYILFGTVSKFEDKYKGAALLCATPYTRNAFVKAKYLFIFVIFISIVMIHIISSIIVPSGIETLNIHTLGITFLILSILFGTLIPVQFKFGYDKTKLISFFVIFLTPFLLPTLIKGVQSNHISFTITLPQIIQAWAPCFISLVIGVVSMIISLNIYAKKDL
ncbi:ABC-2 transporter permease [Bacillus cereus group sp. BfR-BA-01380]|uniref:ABC-2 transporter permease n=1 Tax=Bacillus cereus group sp. BfR-BA-01380 TaxID=2920324 RepID=UPI001F593124|nr:ABC-2 transporter permease [Bacillus cereus group sp. BfR-BA-01380]